MISTFTKSVHVLRRLSLLSMLLLALAACGAQQTSAPPPPRGTDAPLSTLTANATHQLALTALPPDTLAYLQRSGGFSGLTETFVIKKDGTVLIGTQQLRVEGGASAANKLAEQLTTTNIYTVPPGKFLPDDPCCDRRTYDLTLVKDNQTFSYTTVSDSKNTPRALSDAITLVEQYVNGAR